MKNTLGLIIAKLNSTKLGLGVLAALSGATALTMLPRGSVLPGPGPATSGLTMSHTDERGVSIKVRPSQTKLVQGSADELYLDVDVAVPAATHAAGRKPTDLILVLDRSGSMADGQKLEFAKAAVRSLIDRLDDQDRIGLVTFDDAAAVDFPLAAATRGARAELGQLVSRLGTGSGTNISDGLERGRALLLATTGRSSRVILLSDGMANSGVVSPDGLTAIVKSIGRAGAVVSTIGMGLDFNETLLARLADHGMGNYSYLASLSNLGQVLEKDLGDAREQFAAASSLLLDLGAGVQVIDAAGYPVEQDPDGRVRIPLGQLLEGTTRNLTLSLRAPVGALGEVKLAAVELAYEKDGKTAAVRASEKPLMLAVVAPERGAEALASIDAAVLKKSWVSNNAGRMKKDFSDNIRDGNQEAARKVVDDYRAKLGAVQAATGIDTKDAKLEEELDGLDRVAGDAFAGAPAAQAEKQKAYAKEGLSSGLKTQRSVSKMKP